MTKELKRLIEINKQLKELEEEKRLLQGQLIDGGFEDEEIDNFKVYKTTRNKIILKEDVDINDFKNKFPQYIKTSIKMDNKKADKIIEDLILDYPKVFSVQAEVDTKLAEKDPTTHDYLEIKKTEFLTIKEIK